MLKTPTPPKNLHSRSLPVDKEPCFKWYRICKKGFDPLWFNRSEALRFGSSSSKYGVCYSAASVTSALVEVLGDKIKSDVPIPFDEEFETRSVWELSLPQNVKLLPLKGEAIPLIGATLDSFSGNNYEVAQQWAAKLMDHPDGINGLIYIGRRCGTDCLALFGNPAGTDPKSPLQKSIKAKELGPLTQWSRFYPFLAKHRIRAINIPTTAPIISFDAP